MEISQMKKFDAINQKLEKLLVESKCNMAMSDELLSIQKALKECEDCNNQLEKEHNKLRAENKRLKEQYAAMLDNLPDMDVYLFDKKQRFVLTGGQEKTKYGYSKQDFLGKTILDISDKNLQDSFKHLLDSTLIGNKVETEFKNKSKAYKILTQPIYDDNGEIEYGILIGHNITKLKKAQQKLRKAKIEAENTARSKTNFLANMSHEIRTPLNAIIGFSEQLAKTQLTPEQRKFNDLVNESSDILLSLVNEILILLKIGMGKVFIDEVPFDVRKVFEDVYQFFRLKAERKGIELMYVVDDDISPVLVGDPFRLKQVLINLVSNAVKFTDAGSVRFSCSVKKEEYDKVRLRIDVKDTGIGIPVKDQAIIFDEFSQSENMIKEKHGGTGLGLTISKKLIELQKGKIKLKSEPEKGSHFSIVIPYKKGSETDIIKEDQVFVVDAHHLKGKNILLADDDQYNRELAQTIFNNWDVDFDLAQNGEEAYNLANQKAYDIILMDIHMPKLSGMQTTHQIRTEPNPNKQTKIVALTANIVKSDINEYLQFGMDDYLIKPYSEEELFNKVCNVLGIQIDTNKKMPKQAIMETEKTPTIIFDFTDLQKATRGNQMMFNKMLQSFIDNTQKGLEELKHGLKQSNWDLLRETAHRMVSSFRYFKLDEASDVLRSIEKSVINKEFDGIPDKLHVLIDQIEAILEAIEKEKITA
nr:response regulator [uncultured Carboxylicivirga sp.]